MRINRGKKDAMPQQPRHLGRERGAVLFEFAALLPILVVLLVGLLDFATAYNIRQKLANAAREGARQGASQSMLDLTQTSPASVDDIRSAVVAYLQGTNVDTSFISSTMSPAGNFTWTYYSSGNYGLKIERAVQVPPGCGGSPSTPCTPSTRITLMYPYNWTFGFNHIVNLLTTSSYNGTATVPAIAVMANLP
jgi:Flp pilus assembly protein TadG